MDFSFHYFLFVKFVELEKLSYIKCYSKHFKGIRLFKFIEIQIIKYNWICNKTNASNKKFMEIVLIFNSIVLISYKFIIFSW
jgi:hypothetical protein